VDKLVPVGLMTAVAAAAAAIVMMTVVAVAIVMMTVVAAVAPGGPAVVPVVMMTVPEVTKDTLEEADTKDDLEEMLEEIVTTVEMLEVAITAGGVRESWSR
jgi:hypothetical protein